MLSFEGFRPIAEQYDRASGLWCTQHQREDGKRFVIARPYQNTVFRAAAGDTKTQAIANWQRRVAPVFAERLAA